MKFIIWTITTLFFNPLLLAEESDKDFLQNFILGEYKLVGKRLDSNETYFGRVIIFKEQSNLKVKKTIGDLVVAGDAAIENILMGESEVLRIRYVENNESYEETCFVNSDLDNYARMTCNFYKPGVSTNNPGLEAFFIEHSSK